MKTCTLCRSDALVEILFVRDSQNEPIQIFECARCGALVPDYYAIWQDRDALESQTRYHEHEAWPETTPGEMEALRRNCRNIVKHFRDLLDSPEDDSLIGEVGAGRGGLVSALQAEDYEALACEPSSILVSRGRELLGLDDSVLMNCDADTFIQHARNTKGCGNN